MRIVAVAGQRKDRTTQSARLVRQFCESFDQAYDQDRHLASLPASLYVQYGFKRNGSLDAAMEKNIPFVILDRGYFNNRGKCFSVSINGFHGLSMQVPEVWNRPTREHPAPSGAGRVRLSVRTDARGQSLAWSNSGDVAA
jgi:hypothetical protein